MLKRYDELLAVDTEELIHELSDIQRVLLQTYFQRKGLPESICVKLALTEWSETEVTEMINDMRD